MNRKDLARIYQETIKRTDGDYRNSSIYDDRDLPTYEDFRDLDSNEYVQFIHDTGVFVKNQDTISTAIDMCSRGYYPLVLNMANWDNPGGNVKNGSRGQEECIYRCTNYHHCNNMKFYPLQVGKFIVTDNVNIVRNGKNYSWLPRNEIKEVSFITIPAVFKPSLNNKDDYVNINSIRSGIDLIFRYAIYHEYDSLLLGAWGCGGTYGNSPNIVANLFHEAIEKYNGALEEITFAIVDFSGTINFETFRNTLQK
jgi:uncharacterized protein (TIGR02452 family)